MDERSNGNSLFCGAMAWLTALVFVVLKLVGVIDWSWVWVLSPLWIVYGFAFAVLIVLTAVIALTEFLDAVSH